MKDKLQLRRKLLRLRKNMSADERNQKSHLIFKRLEAEVDWDRVNSLHIYRAVDSWNEVATEPIVEWLRQNHPGIIIKRPSTDKHQVMPQTKFDVIIVPVLGFDRRNNRLGLGGGFYDRFLSTQPQAEKIGLAYRAALIDPGIPAESHDIALDKVITD